MDLVNLKNSIVNMEGMHGLMIGVVLDRKFDKYCKYSENTCMKLMENERNMFFSLGKKHIRNCDICGFQNNKFDYNSGIAVEAVRLAILDLDFKYV